jgi:Ni/Co efflux regulator RcnB
MQTKTLAIAGSIAALSFAAAPVAQAASTPHHKTVSSRVDRSRDASGVRHVDKSRDSSRDKSSGDTSRDTRDL